MTDDDLATTESTESTESGTAPDPEAAPAAPADGWDDPARIERVGNDLREALSHLPEATMVLFSAPVPDLDAIEAREKAAMRLAEHAGLQPWPEWAAVRHGVGQGAHVLNIVDELAETGRAEGVVICLLAPIESCLLSQAGAVALDLGLELAVVGDVLAP